MYLESLTKLTVIITASYIKSHPSIKFIKNVINSLKKISLLEQTKIILAHDYPKNKSSSILADYNEYIENLNDYIKDRSEFSIVVRETYGHLTGNIRNVIDHVNTKYILVIQHDLQFVREFNIDKVILDMENNPELKHVRFNKRRTFKTRTDAISSLFGKQIKSLNYTYTRTPQWSDNNHICRKKYYIDIVLKECPDKTPMEKTLWNKPMHAETHKKYGTYIFGALNESKVINHTDGRKKTRITS